MKKMIKKYITGGDDEAIWDDFRKGDEEIQAYLFEAYRSNLLRYGLNMLRDTDFVEDCIQIVYERLMVRHAKLGPTTNIELYLRRCLKSEILKQLERKKLEVPESRLSEEEKFFLIYYPDSPQEGIRSVFPSQEQMEAAIEQLPTDQQQVMKLRKEGFSHRWIAEKLGITVTNCRKRVERARKLLMKKLGPWGTIPSF